MISPTPAQLLLRISNPLILALSLLASGSMLLWVGRTQLEHTRDQLHQASQKARNASEQLQTLQQDEARIRQGFEHFNELASRKVIGPERRLDWIRAINDTARQLELPAPVYRIAPQIQLKSDGAPSDFELMSSTMQLELQLLHEGDLLRFLDALGQTPGALASDRECRLERPADNTIERPWTLRAHCELDWITLRRHTP